MLITETYYLYLQKPASFADRSVSVSISIFDRSLSSYGVLRTFFRTENPELGLPEVLNSSIIQNHTDNFKNLVERAIAAPSLVQKQLLEYGKIHYEYGVKEEYIQVWLPLLFYSIQFFGFLFVCLFIFFEWNNLTACRIFYHIFVSEPCEQYKNRSMLVYRGFK